MPMVQLLILVLATGPMAFCEELYVQKPACPLWDGQESVARYAERVKLPPTKTLDLGNGIKMELVLIPAGKFVMGMSEPQAPREAVAVGQVTLGLCGVLAIALASAIAVRALRKRQRPKFSLRELLAFTIALSGAICGGMRWLKTAEAWQVYEEAKSRYEAQSGWSGDHLPAHLVTLTQPFYLGKYEVTQEQYQQVTGLNSSLFAGKDNPVGNISWNDAKEFCKKVSKRTKHTVRLPTEAEWEYSCRAGTRTWYYSSDTEKDLDRAAWYDRNAKNTAHPAGQKEPNGFGLYDMHGNVAEHCEDWYAEDYYRKAVAENPQGPAQGESRVLRGGSWPCPAFACGAANRNWYLSYLRAYSHGFRVVVSGCGAR